MQDELSAACALIVDAHEAAELAVIVLDPKSDGVGYTPTAAESAEWEDAQTILDAIKPVAAIAKQAMERDSLRSNHPTARILRGV